MQPVRAMRRGKGPKTGLPFSRHMKPLRRADGGRTDATYELWTDKEQLAESGGEDWSQPILRCDANRCRQLRSARSWSRRCGCSGGVHIDAATDARDIYEQAKTTACETSEEPEQSRILR